MDYPELGFFLFSILLVFGISRILDYFSTEILPPFLHQIILFPGVVIHEFSHALACFLTGTPIQKICWFNPHPSENNNYRGYVVHGESKVPIFGKFLIAIAPFLILPIVLYGLTIVFIQFFHIWMPPPQFYPPSFNGLLNTMMNGLQIIFMNIFHDKNIYFIFYYYLIFSLVICIAPSNQDLGNWNNAMLFIVFIAVGIASMYFNISTLNSVYSFIIKGLYNVVILALLFEMVALCLFAPVYLVMKKIRGL